MGSTPTYALPYPELTDSANVPRDQKALAEATETSLAALAATVMQPVAYRMAAGVATMPAISANGGAAVGVTWPVGRFTQPPVLVASAVSNGYGAASSSTTTTSGVGSIKYYNPTSTVPSTPLVYWIAVQMTASTGPGLLAAEEAGTSLVTCHTEGCANSGTPIPLGLTTIGPDGVVEQTTYVVCGVCSQPITDIHR